MTDILLAEFGECDGWPLLEVVKSSWCASRVLAGAFTRTSRLSILTRIHFCHPSLVVVAARRRRRRSSSPLPLYATYSSVIVWLWNISASSRRRHLHRLVMDAEAKNNLMLSNLEHRREAAVEAKNSNSKLFESRASTGAVPKKRRASKMSKSNESGTELKLNRKTKLSLPNNQLQPFLEKIRRANLIYTEQCALCIFAVDFLSKKMKLLGSTSSDYNKLQKQKTVAVKMMEALAKKELKQAFTLLESSCGDTRSALVLPLLCECVVNGTALPEEMPEEMPEKMGRSDSTKEALVKLSETTHKSSKSRWNRTLASSNAIDHLTAFRQIELQRSDTCVQSLENTLGWIAENLTDKTDAVGQRRLKQEKRDNHAVALNALNEFEATNPNPTSDADVAERAKIQKNEADTFDKTHAGVQRKLREQKRDDHAEAVIAVKEFDNRNPNPTSAADVADRARLQKNADDAFAKTSQGRHRQRTAINGITKHTRLVRGINTCKNELYFPRTDNLPEEIRAIGKAYSEGRSKGLSHEQIAKNVLEVMKEYEN